MTVRYRMLMRWGLGLACALLALVALLWHGGARVDAQGAADPRFFSETGFKIDNDSIWDFFSHRGALRTFGYPVSRTFPFMGNTTQFFQRHVVQATPNGVRVLNLLEEGLMPYTTINGSTFPAADSSLISKAPRPSESGYASAVMDFVSSNAPDSWQDMPVKFFETFNNTVTFRDAFPTGGGSSDLVPGFNLELWGVPTAAPSREPHNNNFVYQRFQRGIMHYDDGCRCTQGLLLADYLKAIITGENLPADLAAQASSGPLYKQYDPKAHAGPLRRNDLPNTNLVNAFRGSLDTSSPTAAQAEPEPTETSKTATSSRSSTSSPSSSSSSSSSSKNSSSSSSAKSLTVTEKEWSIDPGDSNVKAGTVDFSLKNSGKQKHQLVIIKTDDKPDDLPMVSGKDIVDLKAAGKVAGEMDTVNAGASGSGSFDLAAGHYVLICNISGHYGRGMHAEITVVK